MTRDDFVLKIQRALRQPKCARKVSGLSRNGPLMGLKCELSSDGRFGEIVEVTPRLGKIWFECLLSLFFFLRKILIKKNIFTPIPCCVIWLRGDSQRNQFWKYHELCMRLPRFSAGFTEHSAPVGSSTLTVKTCLPQLFQHRWRAPIYTLF